MLSRKLASKSRAFIHFSINGCGTSISCRRVSTSCPRRNRPQKNAASRCGAKGSKSSLAVISVLSEIVSIPGTLVIRQVQIAGLGRLVKTTGKMDASQEEKGAYIHRQAYTGRGRRQETQADRRICRTCEFGHQRNQRGAHAQPRRLAGTWSDPGI